LVLVDAVEDASALVQWWIALVSPQEVEAHSLLVVPTVSAIAVGALFGSCHRGDVQRCEDWKSDK
jgi:hypothetical protein